MKFLKYILGITCFTGILYSQNTMAGTFIKNTATLVYNSKGKSYMRQSNTVEDRVVKLSALQLEWIDDRAIMVSGGDKRKVLHFRVTNSGNGNDEFSVSQSSKGSSSFTLENIQLFQDSDSNGVFDERLDAQVEQFELEAGESRVLFVVADIPEMDSTGVEIATEVLTVKNISSPQHTTLPVIKYRSEVSAEGHYEAVNQRLIAYKEAIVDNQVGSSVAVRGAIITYKIHVSMEGIGEIENIVVSDTIPEGTSYVSDSLMLDGNSLSDSIDSDIGQYSANQITVQLPSMLQTDTVKPRHTLSFKVQIL